MNGSYGMNYPMIRKEGGITEPWIADDCAFYNIQLTKRTDAMYLFFCNMNTSKPNNICHSNVEEPIGSSYSSRFTPALRHGGGDRTHVIYHGGELDDPTYSTVKYYKWGENKAPWRNYEIIAGVTTMSKAEIMDYWINSIGYEP